jgi:hypothetical protein
MQASLSALEVAPTSAVVDDAPSSTAGPARRDACARLSRRRSPRYRARRTRGDAHTSARATQRLDRHARNMLHQQTLSVASATDLRLAWLRSEACSFSPAQSTTSMPIWRGSKWRKAVVRARRSGAPFGAASVSPARRLTPLATWRRPPLPPLRLSHRRRRWDCGGCAYQADLRYFVRSSYSMTGADLIRSRVPSAVESRAPPVRLTGSMRLPLHG